MKVVILSGGKSRWIVNSRLVATPKPYSPTEKRVQFAIHVMAYRLLLNPMNRNFPQRRKSEIMDQKSIRIGAAGLTAATIIFFGVQSAGAQGDKQSPPVAG